MLVWIDLETTGLYPLKKSQGVHYYPHDHILEVACIVTDDQLNEIARYQGVTDEARRAKWPEVSDYVRVMHQRNGLWGDSIASNNTIAQISDELCAFLDQHAPGVTNAKGRVEFAPLAGSTIAFDRSFLDVYMPNVTQRVSYRNVDVSVLLELSKRLWPTAHKDKDGEIAHRAMPDIEASIAMARWYASHLAPPQVTTEKVATWLERAFPEYKDLDQTVAVLRAGTWA